MPSQKLKNALRRGLTLLGLALAVVVVIGLALLLRAVPERVQIGRVTLSLPVETPLPTDFVSPVDPFPAHVTEEEKAMILMTLMPLMATPLPMPTSTPTPVVTPVPLAEPPFIPDLPQEIQNYTLLLRDGQVLRTFDRESGTERVVVDVSARTSLLLAERQDRVFPFEWGAASPTDQQVALVLVERSTTKGVFSRFSIHLLDIATGQLDLLVEDGLMPAWSPDGSRIAYRSLSIEETPWVTGDGITQRIIAEELRVVDVATRANTTLFTMEPDVEHTIGDIQWSPNGDQIAFVKTHNDFWNTGAIVIVSADGQGKTIELAPMETNAGTISWSADGGQIAFIYGSVGVIDVSTGEHRHLPSTEYMTISGGGPIWIGDRQWVAFTGKKNFEYEMYPSNDLWLVNVQADGLQRLTQTKESTVYPGSVPNTNRLLFLEQGVGIWELNLDSGERLQVYPEDVEYLVVSQTRR